MSNQRRKYKPSPLQNWKAEYAYVSRTISQMKRTSRNNHVWGTYKVPRTQSLLPFMRGEATKLMQTRKLAQIEAQALWAANKDAAWR